MMDNSSSINERWKLCIIASFTSIVILLFFLSHTHQTLNVNSSLPTIPISSSSSSSFNHTDPVLTAYNHTQYFNTTQPSKFIKDHKNQTGKEKKSCNIYDGKWVLDENSSPLYDGSKQCPFLSDQVSCQRNGRPDDGYEKLRWETKGCEIPKFNGKDMLERLRGKRMIIVGDSLNRNQWESMACLLYSVLPPSRAFVNVRTGIYKVFRAMDYNCSVEFYWSPFLVQLEVNRENGARILKLNELSSFASKWLGADIMIFNTGHWWVHRDKIKAWDLFQRDGITVENMEIETAFSTAMKTWAHWIDQNVDTTKTRVFFRSISPEHKGKQWCYNKTQPLTDESYEETFPKPIIKIVETTMQKMKTPVKYLNITKLSEYRRDAHPTVYNTKQGKMLIAMNQRKAEFISDCSHWCLPGIPDTWNRLLYASMVLDKSQDVFSL